MYDDIINIDGITIRMLTRYSDERGWLTEMFRKDEIPADHNPAMSYISKTFPGQVRGPHEHKFQTDYFCFLEQSQFELYFWDNRPDSKTFGNKFKIKSSLDNIVVVIIPPGIVHAYKNIGGNDGFVVNFPNQLYAGENKSGPVDEIRYEESSNSRFNPF